jgi:hypothetical protein
MAGCGVANPRTASWMSGLERPDEILPVEHGHAKDNSALLEHALREDVWLLALFFIMGAGCCWVASWLVGWLMRYLGALWHGWRTRCRVTALGDVGTP